MKKAQERLSFLINQYVLFTLLGSLLVFFVQPVAMILLTVGANSLYISFGVFLSGDVGLFWRMCSLVWLVMFPVFLIVSYIMFVKKNRYYILGLIAVDVVVSFLYLAYTIHTMNNFAIPFAIADVVISSIILLGSLLLFSKIKIKPI